MSIAKIWSLFYKLHTSKRKIPLLIQIFSSQIFLCL